MTLAFIRWIAVAGQATAVLVVQFGLGLELPLLPALATIAASALLNLVTSLGQPARVWLSDRSAAVFLGYDILQLAALLFLTGGLDNPFALLMMAPVTVSATMLPRRVTIALAGLAVAAATLLMLYHLPLPWENNGLLLPRRYVFGVWSALVLGVAFLAAYAGRVAAEGRNMAAALAAAEQALMREQRLASLGALAAAAAHELGSPLATIAVIARDLARELPADSPLAEDVALLQTQSERCRSILADLSRHPDEGARPPELAEPFSTLIEGLALPRATKAAAVRLESAGAEDSPEPRVQRSPELVHGLANLIDNAVQFARHAVVLSLSWDGREIALSVLDDGPGFPPALLPRLGEPFLSTRAREGGHMGLGIFIAQTLLEATGARVTFANRRAGGARVEVRWPRARLAVESPSPGPIEETI